MPAWGVASGKGVLNEQSINDLVDYLESIVTTPDKAQARAPKKLDDMRKTLDDREVQAGAAKWVADCHGRPQAPPTPRAADASADDQREPTAVVDAAGERRRRAARGKQITQYATDGECSS